MGVVVKILWWYAGTPTCTLWKQVALKPPQRVVIDTVQQAAYEQQLAEAANAPLPDEDDDDIAE